MVLSIEPFPQTAPPPKYWGALLTPPPLQWKALLPTGWMLDTLPDAVVVAPRAPLQSGLVVIHANGCSSRSIQSAVRWSPVLPCSNAQLSDKYARAPATWGAVVVTVLLRVRDGVTTTLGTWREGGQRLTQKIINRI